MSLEACCLQPTADRRLIYPEPLCDGVVGKPLRCKRDVGSRVVFSLTQFRLPVLR